MGQFCSNTCTILLLVILCASSLIQGSEGTCSKPADVANANLRSKYRDIETFNESSEVEYDCNIGYSITGRSRNRKCLKSGNWSPVEFDCELIRCTYLPHPENGRRTDANNGAGETTRFSCNPGYTLKGPSQLVCRTDGEWSPRYTPKCEPILCPELSSLRNGDIFQDTSDGVRNNYGSIAQYTCNYGFTINGTRSRQINRRCEADGTWDGHNYFCDTEKCEPIEFYGGNLQYFGSIHRAEGTYAYYSCHEGYTMSPSGIDYSECKKTSLKWEPEPPKCNGNCRLEEYQPIDTSLVLQIRESRERYAIIHGEKITFLCKYSSRYELCVRPNDQVSCTDDDTLSESFVTTCTNGTLAKINRDTHISCQARRCNINHDLLTNACFWTENDRKERCKQIPFPKVLSGSTVFIKCEINYELFDHIAELTDNDHNAGFMNKESLPMLCNQGKFDREYSCRPKRCDLSSLPSNENTIRKIRREYKINNFETPILSGSEIEYSCKNDNEYELYVSSTNDYPTHFSAKCSLGSLNKLDRDFPLCQEKRCEITASQTNCYYRDQDRDKHCIQKNDKIPSRSSVNIRCNDRYELYDNKNKNYQDVETSRVLCERGTFLTEVSCVPKRCDMADIQKNNFTIRTPDGGRVEHGKSVNTKCNEGYELRKGSQTHNTCEYGKWKHQFPLCNPKPCIKTFQAGEIVYHDNIQIKRTPGSGQTYYNGSGQTYYNGTKLSIECDIGYTMNTKSQVRENMTTECVLGLWRPHLNCIPKSCRVPAVSNADLTSRDAQYYNHTDKVQFVCKKGYHFEQDYIVKENSLQTNANLSSTCEFGKWSKQIPESCFPDGCRFIIMNGSRYFINQNNAINELHESRLIPHDTRISTECISGYDIVKADNSPADDVNPQVTCNLGNWTNIHVCKKRCSAINDSRVMNISDDGIALNFRHGEKVKINCIDDKEITCLDGEWTFFNVSKCPNKKDVISEGDVDDEKEYPAYADATELPEKDEHINKTSIYEDIVKTTQNVLETSGPLQDCKIPNNPSYEYTSTDKDGEINEHQQGSFVTHGTVLNVKCSTLQFGNYYDEDEITTVQCINGKLGTANISCLEETLLEEKNNYVCELQNGQLYPFSNKFNVSCDEGYELNLMRPDKPYCECLSTGLVCDYGGQTPQCLPVPCKIPENHDSRLTIYIRDKKSEESFLSRGMSVQNGTSAYFKCINSATEYLEPNDQRFECMRGKWLEKPTEKRWLRVNTGYFPQCREALCPEKCQNGGTCIRDDTCECQPKSTGKRCETVICDPECNTNGGTCIAPGKCGLCPQGKSGTNCQDQGCPRPENVPKIKHPKDIYDIEETIDSAQFECPQHQELMPRNGMQCSTNGWTKAAECKSKIKYVIQIKTGTDSNAGTFAQVYVYLHGEKYSTKQFDMGILYYRDTLYEITMLEVDITPIRYITVGRGSLPDDLQVDFVSVFVDFDNGWTTTDDQFYNFDAEPDLFVDGSVDQLITMSVWPEQCAHTFHKESRYPLFEEMRNYEDQHFRLGKGYSVSERTCKQRCAQHKKCNGVYYFSSDFDCWGFKEISDRFFKTNKFSNFFKRSCLK